MDQKMEERVEQVKMRLRIVSTGASGLGSLALGLSDITIMEALAHMGNCQVVMDEIKERESRLDRSDFDNWPEEHRNVYHQVQFCHDKASEAFEAILHTAALIYVLIHECQCVNCKSRRQREQARFS